MAGYMSTDFLLDIFLIVSLFVVILLVPLVFVNALKDRDKQARRIRELEEQLRTYRDLLRRTEKKYEAEIKKLTDIAKPLRELGRALEAGVVKIVHAEDGGEVLLLKDGTLVCQRERRVIWPPEGGEDGQREPGMDAG